MRALFFSLAFLSFAVVAAAAVAAESGSANTAALATIRQFVDGLNKGDAKTGLAACAPEAVIIDDFPPHHWQGKQHGKPVTESGATFTVALQKLSGSWRITGWAWAQP